MLNSLRNCIGYPTIVVPTTLAAVPSHTVLLGYLWRELQTAGVPGLHVPRSLFLQQHYDSYFDKDNIKVTTPHLLEACEPLSRIEEDEAVQAEPEKLLRRCGLYEISEKGMNVGEEYAWCTR